MACGPMRRSGCERGGVTSVRAPYYRSGDVLEVTGFCVTHELPAKCSEWDQARRMFHEKCFEAMCFRASYPLAFNDQQPV